MDTLFSAVASTKLYAFHLKLRPLQRGSLMPFSGELVQAAWLDWLRSADPDISAWLHEGNKRRLFTCSSLQFPLPTMKIHDAERNHTFLPLDPGKTYTIRITLLHDELLPVFQKVLATVSLTPPTGGRKPPFMQIGKHLFLLEEVSLNDQSGWTGSISYQELLEKAQARKPGKAEPLTLEFASLTTFSRGSLKYNEAGNSYARLPLPHYVLGNLTKRWQELAPPAFVDLVQQEQIKEYVSEEGIIIHDYNFKPHQVKFTTHLQVGFTGTCTYLLYGPDEPVSDEQPLSIRQQIMLLADFAFYCGVGYKTAMGMGQTRMVESNRR